MEQKTNKRRSVAYFSMEIGIDEKICTYSGGLGVLAGDTIRSAADLKVPMVALTLLYRKGYFQQRLEADGWQREEPTTWAFQDLLQEEPARTQVQVEGRTVHLRAWRYDVPGVSGTPVPIYFLDADLPENTDWDRGLTQSLYGGDDHYRISQEVILGIGGVKMLRALGYHQIDTFHLNEGHAALLTLALLDEAAQQAGRQSVNQQDAEAVRSRCVFTTHTPVPAGHDKFSLALARKVIGNRDDFFGLKGVSHEKETLNMTYLALFVFIRVYSCSFVVPSAPRAQWLRPFAHVVHLSMLDAPMHRYTDAPNRAKAQPFSPRPETPPIAAQHYLCGQSHNPFTDSGAGGTAPSLAASPETPSISSLGSCCGCSSTSKRRQLVGASVYRCIQKSKSSSKRKGHRFHY